MPATRKIRVEELAAEARACTLCSDRLPHGARPVFQIHPQARVLVAGQAPGAKVHESGVPFDDPSGDRLRDWMGVDRTTFYNERQVAILPMGFCYPGRARSGDLPPQRICAETWRESFLDALDDVRLTLAIGSYAQAWHLPASKRNLTETVRAWRSFGAGLIPLPHPSPRNNIWLKKNPWFEAEVLPELKARVAAALGPR